MPCGSSPLVGSSRISSCGRRIRAAARPSRCRMPSEYVLVGRRSPGSSPTCSSTLVDPVPAGRRRRIAVRPGRVQQAEVGARRTGAGTSRALRPGRRSGAAPYAGPAGIGSPEHLGLARASAAPARAASARSSSCRSRWRRGSRRRRPRPPRGRPRRPPAARRSAWSAPCVRIIAVTRPPAARWPPAAGSSSVTVPVSRKRALALDAGRHQQSDRARPVSQGADGRSPAPPPLSRSRSPQRVGRPARAAAAPSGWSDRGRRRPTAPGSSPSRVSSPAERAGRSYGAKALAAAATSTDVLVDDARPRRAGRNSVVSTQPAAPRSSSVTVVSTIARRSPPRTARPPAAARSAVGPDVDPRDRRVGTARLEP